MVGRKEEHAGCKCTAGYEGHYCQFVRGGKPSDWDLADFMHPALASAYGGKQMSDDVPGDILTITIGFLVGFVLVIFMLLGYLYSGKIKQKFSRNDKEMEFAGGHTDAAGAVLGGRRSSEVSSQNSSFVGGMSVYKKNSTRQFVTEDNMEADGSVLQDAMAPAMMDQQQDLGIMDIHSTSMDDVDLMDDGPSLKGELA